MKRKLLFYLNGAAAGIAMEWAVALAVSMLLKLGYVMLAPAWLPEYVGGEINAVLLLTTLFAFVGIFIKRMLNSARSD